MSNYDHLERLKTAEIQPCIEEDGVILCSRLCLSCSKGKWAITCEEDGRDRDNTTSWWEDCRPFQRLMAEALRPGDTPGTNATGDDQ